MRCFVQYNQTAVRVSNRSSDIPSGHTISFGVFSNYSVFRIVDEAVYVEMNKGINCFQQLYMGHYLKISNWVIYELQSQSGTISVFGVV
jgi:hypothetical protein